MITNEKLLEVIEYDKKHSVEETMGEFLLSAESLARYWRRYNQIKDEKPTLSATLPKILLFDIETAPNLVYTWGLFKQNIGINQIKRPWYTICWAAKWLFSDKILSDVLAPEDAENGHDELIIRSIWDLLNEADIVVAHNLYGFDKKRVQAKFMEYKMPPPEPYQTIDTLTVAKSFDFTSRKLDYLGGLLVGSKKIKTDFDLWRDCMEGDKTALRAMVTYCKQDVKLLEEVYLELRPWIKSHPNCGLYQKNDEMYCANCGSTELKQTTKPYRTDVNVYTTYRCECGALVRVRHTSKTSQLKGVARV